MISSKNLTVFILIFLLFSVTSCAAVQGIFTAGMQVGIFMVVAVLVLIVFIIMKLRKK